MKKLIAFICIFVLSISCTQEPDGPRVRLELVPVETVVLPTTFTANTVNEIEVTYSRPSSCHGFEGFYYTRDGFNRTIAVLNYVIEEQGCLPLLNQLQTKILRFKPATAGTYLLKFWKGKDAAGVNLYEEFSVVVQ
ncbi:hypothetical protein [Flavobacterium sp.]|jgi:hypothetical protein|uniref:hypothetical protein n=1 Tax=Flavobacterium sp. TaxID=239 RepID=UPI0037BED9DE